jgi:ATP-dependent Clp protease protease subunit
VTKDNNEAQLPSLEDHNIYLFMDGFEDKSVRPLIEFILRKNLLPTKQRPEHLTLIINSPGGELPSAFALIDVMKGSAIPIHTVGLGQIASCGIITFMAGAKGHRIVTPSTSIMSHQYSWGQGGKHHELLSTVKEFELTSKRMLELYQHCTGMDEKTIRKVLLPAHDVWLTPEEAVKYGIADEIKETF